MPRPPYSSDTIAPRNPMSASFCTSSVSKRSLRSLSRARGMISRSANSLAVSRTRSCSSVSSKSITRRHSARSGPFVSFRPFSRPTILVAQLARPELYTRAVDEFGVFVFGSIAIVVFVFLAIGKWYPGSGAEQVDWKPTRSYEDEVRLELEDVDQMIEAQNDRRRASGRPEISEEQIRAEVEEEERWREQEARRYRGEG